MSNNGSDEIAVTPEEQRRSFTEVPDRRSSCCQESILNEHFQFYHTWSPTSPDEIDDGYGNIDENDNNNGAYPITVAPPNYGALQSPPPLTPRQKRYERQNNDSNNNSVDTKQKTDAATNFLTALDIKGDSDISSGVTNSAPPVLNTPQRLKQSLNSLLSSPISNPLFDDDDEAITHHKILSPSLTNGDNDEDVFANDHLHNEFYLP